MSPSAESSATFRALCGFFVSGLLLSFLGAVLPAWGYHLRPHYVTVGNYFLAIYGGVVIAVVTSRRVLARFGTRDVLKLACGLGFASMLTLSLTAPPAAEGWRLPGLMGVGASAGFVNVGVFHAITPVYRVNPAGTVNLAGVLFGFGSLSAPLLIAGSFNLYSVGLVLLLVAIVPAAFTLVYGRMPAIAAPLGSDRHVREVLRDFTRPGAVLLSLLLFVHFGNEWAIAGWLPLFVIQRLGMSPVNALILLAGYFLALLIGRLLVQLLLRRVSHARLLLGSAVASLFGCLVLTFTNNLFGAWLGTLFVGFGFAPIYPLAVERIGDRFPYYHPGLFNGIFSAGLTGGMLAPATLGYAGEFYGVGIVMALPALGTFVVTVLVVLIALEARIAKWNTQQDKAV